MPLLLSRRTCALIPLAFLVLIAASPTRAKEVKLEGDRWTIFINPSTLRVIGTPTGGSAVTISDALPALGPVANQIDQAQGARWSYSNAKLTVEMRLENDVLIAHFTAADAGSFSWPIIGPDPAKRAFILPMFEGVYVPTDDEPFATFLAGEGPLNTTSDLSMPFFALESTLGAEHHTITYLLTNQFNNELTFRREAGRLAATFTHTSTQNHAVKQFGFQIHLGGPSPVEPAKIYRDELIARKEFVSLADKIKHTPDAAKLLGAAHVYLWGNGLISRYDFADAKQLARQIVEQSRDARPSPGKQLWTLLDEPTRKLIEQLQAKQWIDNYDKSQLADALSATLLRRDFSSKDAFSSVALADETASLAKQDIASLDRAQLIQLNCLLLHDAFAAALKPVVTWGDGLSPKMIQSLHAAGLDRLWLGSPDWDGLRHHPATVQQAIALGYLIGPYDSFHSIHAPGSADTWETAQFDQHLYDTGAVIKADGTKKTGFKKKGYILNCAVARPAVEKRVAELMRQFKCNSWFVDCDADGELFDDYSSDHPATMEQDKDARLSRLAWIRESFGAVIGSERGSSYAAGVIHFAHGMMTPGIGWGDPDLADRNSPYYLGNYYPPDGPACFFKTVPMKPIYRHIYADPRFRLPLYQTAFHDSLVTTHQWGSASLKYEDPDHARELLELLYNVPPLYHLNLASWEKQKASIVAHFVFFSPLHRESALLPMSDFQWLTGDRSVQRSVFGDKIEMIANFSETPFVFDGVTIAKQSILSRRLDTKAVTIYAPVTWSEAAKASPARPAAPVATEPAAPR